jgi:hypothetical protein
VVSDQSGSYVLALAADSDLWIVLQPPQSRPDLGALSFNKMITQDEDFDMLLPPGQQLTDYVHDAMGRPIEGALVEIFNSDVTNDFIDT